MYLQWLLRRQRRSPSPPLNCGRPCWGYLTAENMSMIVAAISYSWLQPTTSSSLNNWPFRWIWLSRWLRRNYLCCGECGRIGRPRPWSGRPQNHLVRAQERHRHWEGKNGYMEGKKTKTNFYLNPLLNYLCSSFWSRRYKLLCYLCNGEISKPNIMAW